MDRPAEREGREVDRFTDGYAFFLLILAVLVALLASMLTGAPVPWRAGTLAFVFGASVGVAEVISRYRDEPLQATFSPFGLIYVNFNGAIALGLLAVILRYRTQLSLPASLDSFWAALLAGFGSTALMRTRLAVIRSADNKDISIGPDIIIKTLLQMVDQYIDRARAQQRLKLVVQHIADITRLGDEGKPEPNFALAADYMLASLLAFQSLDEERKKQLNQVMTDYKDRPIPSPIKFFALGFIFLTLTGERQFRDVVKNAVGAKEKKPPGR